MSITIAEKYYTAMGNNDLAGIEAYVDENIEFIGPFAEFQGKQQYIQVVKNFMAELESLTIRSVVGSADQATVIYDVVFPTPIGKVRGAALMDFQQDKVTRVELFYDTRPLVAKAEEIFSK